MALMKIRLKTLLIILVLVLIYAAYYWGIPAALNIQNRIPEIQKIAKRELGTDIKIENPQIKMGLTPSVWFDASYLEVIDPNASPLSVINPKIKIQLLPLLIGKVHLVYFSCDKISADLKIDKKYRLYIGNHLIIKNSNPKFSLEDSQMYVEGYNIKFNDEVQNKKILLKGDYFDLEKYNSKKYIKLSTNSNLMVDNNVAKINLDLDLNLPVKKGFSTNDIFFDGTITNLNLSDLSLYVKKISNGHIKQIGGVLNSNVTTNELNRKTKRITTQTVIKDFSFMTKDNSLINFKNKLNLNLAVDVSKNLFKINKIKFLSGTTDLDIIGKVNNIAAKNPNLDLGFIVNKVKTEDIVSLLPEKNIKNVRINIEALKKYGFYSDLSGKVQIKGKADKPDITGDFLSTNAYIIKPLPSNVPKSTVKLKFLGRKTYMDITVPVTEKEKVFVKGTVDLYDGNAVDLNVSTTENIDLERTESILNPIHEVLYFDLGPLPVMKLKGLGDIKLKIKGTQVDLHLMGKFNFRNTTASFDGLDVGITHGSGVLSFEDTNTVFNTQNAFLNGRPVKIKGTCSLAGVIKYELLSNGQDLGDLINIIKSSPKLQSIQKMVSIKSAGGKTNLDIKLEGKVKNINEFELGKTVIASGQIKLLGNNIVISNLDIPIKNVLGNIKFKGSDIDFDLYSIVDKSKLNLKGKVRNNVLTSKMKLDDVNFMCSNIPVKIYTGNVEIKDDRLQLYKVNAALDGMPIFIDGYVTNIFKEPNANLYLNSKPTQKFIEKYLNKNAAYPLKIKGDIVYSSRIRGTKDSFGVKTEVSMAEDSSIYYMGSTLGDTNDAIRIFIDANLSKKQPNVTSIYVNNFQYDKLINSQNDKEFVSQQMNARGQINFGANDIKFNDFKVRTQNPTDAKLFNLLFKKPLIKQGVFSSNLRINNSISSPKMIGSLNFTGINIPLFDTMIKDISLDFANDNIDIKSKGEIFSNKLTFFGNMENRLIAPYVVNDVDIYLDNLDINKIISSLQKMDFSSGGAKTNEQKLALSPPDLTNLVIKKAKIKAENVLVKNVSAKKLDADCTLNEKLVFSVDNFKFDIAQGAVNGSFDYNLLNSKTSLDLHVDNVNANSIADTLFDLPNQIYGSLTGKVNLTCNGKTNKTCMDTLSGTGGFRVVDGKMPKLGSLEYLLKAANIIKSGVTGITLNSIIDLITPLKTGQFENINGSFNITSGIADSIQIFSKGKDLSIFITGTYNFSNLIADMEVFGRVSKKVSNGLGAIGNTSLNTLFNAIPGLHLEESNNPDFVKNLNKIPGFELNDKTYRIFSAEIYGDIKGDNYVQSFKWVE